MKTPRVVAVINSNEYSTAEMVTLIHATIVNEKRERSHEVITNLRTIRNSRSPKVSGLDRHEKRSRGRRRYIGLAEMARIEIG